MYRHLYYKLQRQITQQTYIYKDIYINTTNVNFPAHKKFPNVTLWFCATQQISETTKHVNFPAQITETTWTSITRKPHNKFLQIENSQYIPPFKCYTQQKQQKNPIVPNQKSRTSHNKKNPIVPFRCYSNTKVFLILPKTT